MKNQLTWAFVLFVIIVLSCKPASSGNETDGAATQDTTASAMAPAEFADQKYADIARSCLDAFEAGDVAAYMAYFADNAVYNWNNGDSIAGKAAINEYWTKRRGEVIDSISMTNEIFLPVKVNKPQSVEAPGVWVLAWYETTARYNTGKSMTQWIHADMHFDSNDKIDRVISYLDWESIKAAATK